MSFLKSIFGKAPNPSEAVSIRDTLFGDMPMDQWPPNGSDTDTFPWNNFRAARSQLAACNKDTALKCWQEIAVRSDVEPRHRVQAWHFLREHGQQPSPACAKEILGVVVEVVLAGGLDLLAAYPDYSARYYNYSGSGVVWEHSDDSLNATINELLEASKHVVAVIGPWDKARPPMPPRDHARMSFLTPSGLHFGQGPMAALAQDPLGGRVLHAATRLMQALIAKSKPAKI